MSNYSNFIRKDLDSGIVVCEDVCFPSGSVCTVFFSTGSIYVLSAVKGKIENHLHELYEALSPNQLRLYVTEDNSGCFGLYDPLTQSLGSPMDDDTLSADVQHWLSKGLAIYDRASMERMIARLKHADILARGYAADESGERYLVRHGTLQKASEVSSDTQYYLTLFGGTLGLHRFALGKPMSGLLYLFTGGLMLAGWLLDLLQLFIGAQKDSKKRYLFPMSNIKKKLFLLPAGLFCGFLSFLVFLTVTDMFGRGIGSLIARQAQNTDPAVVQNLIDSLLRFFSQFS